MRICICIPFVFEAMCLCVCLCCWQINDKRKWNANHLCYMVNGPSLVMPTLCRYLIRADVVISLDMVDDNRNGALSIQLKAWTTPKEILSKESQRQHQTFSSPSSSLDSFSVFEIETVNANCRQVFACYLAVVTLETGIMKSRLAAVPAKICLSIGYEPRILIGK